MKLTEHRFTELLAAFRSSEPTPGGGSASALASAVGASLLAMVAGLPKPRAANADESARLAAAGTRATELSSELSALIDRDSDAYDSVVAAFRMPKGSDDEKGARTAAIQQALHEATETPLRVMRASVEAIRQAADVAAFGNHNASSDVQVGLELLAAGLRGAKLNVEINLASLKDAAFISKARKDAERLTTEAEGGLAAARSGLPDAG